MPGSSDGSVEIRIKGSVDGSLRAATAEASATMQKTGATAAATSAQFELFSSYTGAAAEQLDLFSVSAAQVAPVMRSTAAAVEAEAAATEVSTLAHGRNRAVTESLVVVHEALQGRLSRIPGSLMILAQAAGGASTGMLLMGGAVAAVAAGLGYLAYEAYEAEKKAEGLAEGFALTGRTAGMTADAVTGELDQLRQLPGVTSAIAEATMQWDAAHGEVSDQIKESVNSLLPQYVLWLQHKAPEALGTLKASLNSVATDAAPEAAKAFEKINESMLHLAPAQAAVIENMIMTGDRSQAVTNILQSLATKGGGHIDDLKRRIAETRQEIAQAQQAAQGFEVSLEHGGQMAGAFWAQALEKVKELQERLRQLQGEMGNVSPARLPLGALQEYRGELEKNASLARDTPQQRVVDSALIEAATAKLKDMGEAEYRVVTTAKQAREILGAQADDIARTAAAGDRHPMAGTDFASAGQQAIDQARQQITEIEAAQGESATERYSKEQQIWQSLLNGDKLNAAQRLDVARELNQVKIHEAAAEAQEELDFTRKTNEQFNAMARSDAEMQIEVARHTAEEKRKLLDQQLAAKKIAPDDYLSQSLAAINEETQAEIAAQNLRIKQAGDDVATIRAAQDQKVQIYMQANDQIVALGADMVDKLKQQNERELADWRNTISQITSAEDMLVRDIFTKRQSLGADLAEIGGQMAEREVADDLKASTEMAAQAAFPQTFAAMQPAASEGVLMHGVSSLLGIGSAQPAATLNAGQQAALQTAMTANTSAITALSPGITALTPAVTALTPAVTALTAALTGHSGVTVANTAAMGGHAAQTAANSVSQQANAAAMEENSGATSENSGSMLESAASWIENTVATIANTAATEASAIGHLFGFAAGGYKPAGQYAIVGEKGPEILGPGVAGYVTPNSAFRRPISLPDMAGSSSSMSTFRGGDTSDSRDQSSVAQQFHFHTTMHGQPSKAFRDMLEDHAMDIGRIMMRHVRRGTKFD